MNLLRKWWFWLIIVLALLIFFYPKSCSGSEGIGGPISTTTCDCLGFKAQIIRVTDSHLYPVSESVKRILVKQPQLLSFRYRYFLNPYFSLKA
jgi:hypothetical protein